jgi:phosphotransferase system, enzyme I, PtsP
VVENYRHRIASRGQLRSEYERIKDNPAITLDGHRIELMLNAGLLVDLPQIARTGADGIGLFRTEFQFLVAEQMPRIRQQIALYESALIEAGDKPVTFRTLDLGGDKILNFARAEREENPALGWRGARMAIDRPRLARYQLRGLIRAAAGRSLRLMFPGITTTEEFLFLRGLLDMEIARAERRNHLLPQSVKVGAMIETPAIAFDASALLAHADFISVGANDLAQHFFAADRDNARVNERYDPLHPAFLRLLQSLVTAARTAQSPIAICGEIAGQPLAALALIGLGYRTLSMAAPQIGPVKQAILGLNTALLSDKLTAWMQTSSESLREPLRTFAELHAIRLGGEG